MYFKMTRAAVTVAGGVVALCLGSVPAALAAQAQNTSSVPCDPQALNAAIGTAHQGETLDLAPGCTYALAGALPHIKTNLTIVGHHSTLTRTRNATGFSLLTVRGADLTVINVNFTDGGGYKVGKGGAIDNTGGTLNVTGGTFSGNETDNVGGAIYNDGHMTVKNATFTHNLAPYGGAIENDHNASITRSTFTRNKPSLHGDPRNSDGGAIYNNGYLYLTHTRFVGNSTGGNGGAIYTQHHLDARHITVTAGAAGLYGGGIYNDAGKTATLFASVVSHNQPNNCNNVPGC
jgi:predicted outer membrane repeat protein